MYFLTVLANTAGFSYSFWNEPAPSDAAELFAVLSLPGLAVSVVVMGYVVYGAYCVMLVDASRVVVPVRRARCSDAPSIRLYDRGGGRRRCFWRRRHRWSCFPFLAPVPFQVILSRKPPLRGPYSFGEDAGDRSVRHRAIARPDFSDGTPDAGAIVAFPDAQ